VNIVVRKLVIILGDQLNLDSPVLRGLDNEQDCIWMAEVAEEATSVWSHKARLLLFLSAMRNFCKTLRSRGYWIIYHKTGNHNHTSLSSALLHDLRTFKPQSVCIVHPGEHRILKGIRQTVSQENLSLEVMDDTHFLITQDDFDNWAKGKKQLRMENFYRFMRKRNDLLIENGKPVGGKWSYDKQNRGHFTKYGPAELILPEVKKMSITTLKTKECVEKYYSEHPGSIDNFSWPVTRSEAKKTLKDFVEHRLYPFGQFQDAMWTKHPFLFHSRLSAALNLKLLSPHEVVDEVIQAWENGRAPIESVEGFLRQIIGWREYIRGMYWKFMPDYAKSNFLEASLPLPHFYWTAETDMRCMHETISQVIEYGYAHHIQRLMVTGLFALLLGVNPARVHEWYLAMFVDAVEWVELPNTIGMSQYADGGILASKPYVASGKYINRMSNYCKHCRYNPNNAIGKNACPFTTLYWNFLIEHENKFATHPRVALQWKHVQKLDSKEKTSIRLETQNIRSNCFEIDVKSLSRAR